MDNFPTQVADLLETAATKIRGLTVDRVARWMRWAAAGIVLAMLALVLTIFTIVALFRIVGGLVTVEGAYLLFGGIFLGVGGLLWSKRTPDTDTGDE